MEALRHLKLDIRNTTVAIQGFGNVGSHTARIMQECGARVIAVSDVQEASTIRAVWTFLSSSHATRPGANLFRDTKLGDWLSNDELLQLDCTSCWSLPRSPSRSPKHNAAKLRCRILAEGGEWSHDAGGRSHAAGPGGLYHSRHPGSTPVA